MFFFDVFSLVLLLFAGSFQIMEQFTRPSWHSTVLLLSHCVFILPVVVGFLKDRIIEGLSIIIAICVSFSYHLCDENYYCLNGNIYQWHTGDVWMTFCLVTGVYGVSILRIERPEIRILARIGYFMLSTICVIYDQSSTQLGLLLYATIIIPIICYRKQVLRSWYSKMGLVSFAVAITTFICANNFGQSLRTGKEALTRPDVPETTLYWFFHSLWHLFIAISATCIIMSLGDEVDLIKKD